MLLLLSLLFLVTPAAAQYDLFTFNVTMTCLHQKVYTYDATFNIRNEEPNRPITYGQIGHVNGQADGGDTTFKLTGFFEFELSRAPVWEPIAKINHNCLPAGSKKGFKSIKMNFASVPAERKKIHYIYTFQINISDKEGQILPDAEIKIIR